MATTWILSSTGEIADLVELGRQRADGITAVVVGDADVAGVDSAITIALDADMPVEALAPVVAQTVSAGADDVVLVADTPTDRVLGGAVAAKLNAPVLVGVRSLGEHTAEVSRFGAITLQTVHFDYPVVAVHAGGSAVEGEAVAPQSATGQPHAARVSSYDVSETPDIDIAHAQRVICAGRGFENKEDLQLAHDLADALGAELGVSRPLAEGYGWMPRESYIGVSGQIVAPELYIAIGISGQIHHTAGVTDSQTIVAINNDELATIFDFADYGIVGDLYAVLPELTAALAN